MVPRLVAAAASALLLTVVLAALSVHQGMTAATADTIPCFNGQGQQVPCPTTTTPPPTNPPPTNPPATNPPATNPPATNPPATNPPDTTQTTVAPTTTAVPTTTTTTAPPQADLGPSGIFGGRDPGKAPLATTTTNPDPSPTDPNVASGIVPKSKGISTPFVGAMVLDGLLLFGIAGYVIRRRMRRA